MSDEELFDEFLKGANGELGTRFDVTSLPEGNRLFWEHRLTAMRSSIKFLKEAIPSLPSIHVNLFKYRPVNAFADEKNGWYFIGYSTGTEWLLFQTFLRMLADPRIFPEIGSAAMESQNLPPLATQKNDGWVAADSLVVPRDQVRTRFARLLLDKVAMFIFLHEFAHIADGYVDWQKRNSITARVRQTAEVYADRSAAIASINNSMVAFTDDGVPDDNVKDYYGSPCEALYVWGFAMCVFFRLFGDNTLATFDRSFQHYPPWRFRQAMVLHEAVLQSGRHKCCLKEMGSFDGAWKTAMNRSIRDAEMAFSLALGGVQPQTDGLRDAVSKEAWEYRDVLRKIWRGWFKADLLKHAYVDQLPD